MYLTRFVDFRMYKCGCKCVCVCVRTKFLSSEENQIKKDEEAENMYERSRRYLLLAVTDAAASAAAAAVTLHTIFIKCIAVTYAM